MKRKSLLRHDDFPLGIEDCRPREETCVMGRPIEIQQQPIVFAEWMALPKKILS